LCEGSTTGAVPKELDMISKFILNMTVVAKKCTRRGNNGTDDATSSLMTMVIRLARDTTTQCHTGGYVFLQEWFSFVFAKWLGTVVAKLQFQIVKKNAVLLLLLQHG
jgi:hypothetical protein